jgi:hypothetical protein
MLIFETGTRQKRFIKADCHRDAEGRTAMRPAKRGQARGEILERCFSRQRKGERAPFKLGDHPVLGRANVAKGFHGLSSSISGPAGADCLFAAHDPLSRHELRRKGGAFTLAIARDGADQDDFVRSST